MDHSYGVLQDSGMSSPNRTVYKSTALKSEYVEVKSENLENEPPLYDFLMSENLGCTEEVETTDSDSMSLANSNSGGFAL